MNELVFVEKNKVVTDSLTIADVFGKDHKNVLRDISTQIEYAGEGFARLNFERGSYKDKNNQSRPKYNLTEEAFTLVAMSYNTREAVQMKVKFIQEFKKMRTELANKNLPSYSIEDPIERAKKWILEQTEKKMLEQRLAETEPKVTYYDEILKSTNTVNISQIAKDYGLSGQALNSILHDDGVQYKLSGQWLLYSKHQDKGYTKSETQEYTRSNGEIGTKLHTKWTQKGRLFIHQVLGKRGIVPVMDRESEAS
jgi:Rha family phage regulatory protein